VKPSQLASKTRVRPLAAKSEPPKTLARDNCSIWLGCRKFAELATAGLHVPSRTADAARSSAAMPEESSQSTQMLGPLPPIQ